ncbi:hypothetical protein ACFVZH_20850 [Streptomyces sp. NPDC059534]|uniref:hypothetical protein n=1 Tax=Streptomyces sp. NPDC059534 TaxID=3346859 RepID=UPI00367F33F2
MKYSYRATRGDQKALLRDIKPGDSLFIVNQHAGCWGPAQTYREYIVTDKKTRLTGQPMVQATSHGGIESVVDVLAREREIYTERPVGIPNVAVKNNHGDWRGSAWEDAAERTASTLASRYRNLARR